MTKRDNARYPLQVATVILWRLVATVILIVLIAACAWLTAVIS